ncbi:DUF6082 family protein [Streptomyces sp. NPDC004539]|uniref:DUF6082 family protein n=1 Tax=Streptomyces sp. NPDC004539 TaxID=3154280 RepID=UPI0033B8C87A
MAPESVWHSARRSVIWFALATVGTALVGVMSIVVSGWLLDGVEEVNGGFQAAARRSALGDYFGAVSAVFSGIAVLLLVVTLFFQQRELRMQREELSLQRLELIASREELRRSAAADLRGLHVQLTQMQMNDPVLAEVWNDWPGQDPDTVRQLLFANLTYSQLLLHHEWGEIPDSEIIVHARRLLRSPVFQQYWILSREAKQALSPDSPEGRFFRCFDQALRELMDGEDGAPPA